MEGSLITQLMRKEFRRRPAFRYVDSDVTITYGDAIIRAEKFHWALKKQGVNKGDYVIVSMENEHDWLAAILSLASIGAVIVPVNHGITRFELARICKRVPIKYTLSDYDFILQNSQCLVQMNDLEAVITIDQNSEELSVSLLPIHSLIDQWGDKREKLRVPRPTQTISCHFTFKGFGVPLGVLHTYDDFCKAVESCQPIFNFKTGHRLLILLPCYPVFGLVTNLLYPLAYGCELVIQEKKVSNILKLSPTIKSTM